MLSALIVINVSCVLVSDRHETKFFRPKTEHAVLTPQLTRPRSNLLSNVSIKIVILSAQQ